MQPKRWKINLPFRDYVLSWRIPFLQLLPPSVKSLWWGAMAAAFATPLGLSDAFILENVRYEMLIAAFFVLILSGFILPTSNLPGTHGPLIPLIPIVVAAGGHPLAFGVLMGVFGIALALCKGGSLMARLTSKRGGRLTLVSGFCWYDRTGKSNDCMGG